MNPSDLRELRRLARELELPASALEAALDCGIFDSAETARAAHQQALSWVKENLADLSDGAEPEVTIGEVLAQVH